MDFTQIISETIKSLSKSRGEGFAKLYLKYAQLINSGIVVAGGLLLYFFMGSFLPGILGIISSVVVVWLWFYMNFVGGFAHLWGFKAKPQKVEVKPSKKKSVKMSEFSV